MIDQSEILTEARGARKNSEQLLPLLQLLEETQSDTGPLDELKGILSAILDVLADQTRTLARIESAYSTPPP